MQIRRKIAIVALLLIAAFIAIRLYNREPRYQGKPLSVWLEQFANAGRPAIATSISKQGAIVELRSRESGKVEEARTAIRAIGTKALPYLMRDLRISMRDSATRSTTRDGPGFFGRFYDQIFGRWTKVSHSVEPTKNALAGFRALEDLAVPALPELQALSRHKEHTADALDAMTCVGPRALPFLEELFQSPDASVRLHALTAIAHLKGDEARRRADLLTALADRDWLVRVNAAGQFMERNLQSSGALSAVTNLLSDTNLNVRRAALATLATFHPTNAAALISVIAPVLFDPILGPAASNAIYQIQMPIYRTHMPLE